MRRLTPLFALLIAAPAAAQEGGPEEAQAKYLRAEMLEDVEIYSLAENYDADFWNSGEPFGAIAGEWTEIGEVEDVILDRDGRVAGVATDIGGFLGIGRKEVLLPFEDIRLVQLPDEEALFVVTRLDEAALEEREELQTLWDD